MINEEILDRKDYPQQISKIISALDFKIDRVEKSASIYTLYGRSNDWIGYNDLRYLATVHEVLKIGTHNSVLTISISEK